MTFPARRLWSLILIFLITGGCSSDPTPSGHYRMGTATLRLGDLLKRQSGRSLIDGTAQSAVAFAVLETGEAVASLELADALEGGVGLVEADSTVKLDAPYDVPIRILAYDFETVQDSVAAASDDVAQGRFRSRYYSDPVSLTAGVNTQVVYLTEVEEPVPDNTTTPPPSDNTTAPPEPVETFSGFFYFSGCSIEDNEALNPIPIILLFSERLDNQTVTMATSQPCQDNDTIVLRKDGVCQDLNFLDFAAAPDASNFNSEAPFDTFASQTLPKYWAHPDNGTYTLTVSAALSSASGAVLEPPIESTFTYTNGWTHLQVSGCDYLLDYDDRTP